MAGNAKSGRRARPYPPELVATVTICTALGLAQTDVARHISRCPNTVRAIMRRHGIPAHRPDPRPQPIP